MESYLISQTVFIPLASAVLILILESKKGGHAGWVAVLSLVYTSFLLVWIGVKVWDRGQVSEVLQPGPEMGFNLMADGLNLPIALVVNLICLALAVYSFKYVDHRIHLIYLKKYSDETGNGHQLTARYRKRFFFLYLFFPSGFMGVAFSTNLLSVYLFLEILTIIPLYFIMAQFGYSDYISRFRVALICLFWGVAGASLFLIAILMGHDITGSFEISTFSKICGHANAFRIILLILLGLGAKLAIFPLHVWMPWVHAEHPTCIAGLLAVYANIAVYLMVRILILPLSRDMSSFQVPLMVLAVFTMVYGAFLTLAQTDAKRFCACSTISQISYSVFGVMAMTPMGIKGGIFYFLSHILGKALLFSTAGILVYRTGTRDLGKMRGLGRRMPMTAVLWMTSAMVLSALPPFSGFVGKWLFVTGGFQALGQDMPGVIFMAGTVLSTLLTLIYTFKTGIRIFFGELNPDFQGIKDAPGVMVFPLVFLAVFTLIFGIFPGPVLHLLPMGID